MTTATKRKRPPTTAELVRSVDELRADLGKVLAQVTPTPVDSAALLEAQARRNALRTFVQGLAIDVAVAAAILVAQLVSSPLEEWQGWTAVGIALARTVLGAAASYVMRRFVDGSRIPTPLPIVPEATPVELESGERITDDTPTD